MSEAELTRPEAADGVPAGPRLSTLDRLLPVWIVAAMVAGLVLGRAAPRPQRRRSTQIKIDSVSLPIALGLLVMMYPVLAKVRYDPIGHRHRPTGGLLVLSLVLNWLVGPALMFALAWLMLPDLPEYRTGLIIVGLARCIAMVLIWNDLACGDREARRGAGRPQLAVPDRRLLAARLLLPPGAARLAAASTATASTSRCGRSPSRYSSSSASPWSPASSPAPSASGPRAREWYENRFLPRIGPVALYGLLFTIVVLFALQGERITDQPLDVARIALPLLVYFAVMWFGSFALGLRMRPALRPQRHRSPSPPPATTSNWPSRSPSACSASSSGQALAGVVGPLIEVPVLVGLVYVALLGPAPLLPRRRQATCRRGYSKLTCDDGCAADRRQRPQARHPRRRHAPRLQPPDLGR